MPKQNIADAPRILTMESGGDPNAAVSNEVTAKSETEAVMIEGTQKVMTLAEQVAARWAEREARDGVEYWICPFDNKDKRQEFKTKRACQTYMNKTYKNSIEAAKLRGEPESSYTPNRRIHSPKRTLADLVTPEQAKHVEVMEKARSGLKDLQAASRGLAGQTSLKAAALMGMSEQQAIEKVATLPDEELKNATYMAWTRSKAGLLKKCRRLCAERNIPLLF